MSTYTGTMYLGFKTALLAIGCAFDPQMPIAAVIVCAVFVPLMAWLESV